MTKKAMLIQLQYARIWRTLPVEMYYNTMKLQVVMQLFFYINRKVNPSKEVLKNQAAQV